MYTQSQKKYTMEIPFLLECRQINFQTDLPVAHSLVDKSGTVVGENPDWQC